MPESNQDLPPNVPFLPTEDEIEDMATIAKLEDEWLTDQVKEDLDSSWNDRQAWMNRD